MPRPPGTAGAGIALVRLTQANAAGLAGDGLVTVSLAGSLFFTVAASAARPRVLLYLLLTMAPFAVVAPVVGPVIDRLHRWRRLVLAATNVGRAVLCVLMFRDLTRTLLYPEAFGVLVLGKAAAVARNALLPTVVAREGSYVDANARLTRAGLLAGAGAGLMGAGVLKLGGGRTTLMVAAGAYLAAGVATLRIPASRAPSPSRLALGLPADGSAEPPPATHAPATQPPAIRPSAAPVGLAAGAAMGLLRAMAGFLTFLLAFALKRSHAPSWVDGLVIAGGALGSFAGAVVAPALRRRYREEGILVVCLATVSLAALAVGWHATRPGLGALAFIAGVAHGAGRVAFDSIVQRDAPEAERGRLFAHYEARFQLAWVLGGLVPVAIPLGTASGLAAMGAALAVTTGPVAAALRAARHDTGLAPSQLPASHPSPHRAADHGGDEPQQEYRQPRQPEDVHDEAEPSEQHDQQ